MTRSEFDKWAEDLVTRFPALRSWLYRLCNPTTGERPMDQRAMLGTWADVLRDVDLPSALEVNRQMQAGDLPFVEDFHEQDIPSHVRRLARQLAYQRRAKDEPDNFDRRPSNFPAGKIMRRIFELTDRGITSEEAKAMVLAELPVGIPRWSPRFACPICFDVGFITVASQAALDAMLDDRFEKCHHKSAAMLCSCKAHLAQNSRRPRAVYDPALAFKVEDYLWRQTEVDRFKEWVEFKRGEQLERTCADKFNSRDQAETV